MQKYQVNQYTVENVVNWVKSGEIAIPEIQRPFVWNRTKVRDLMDSLYQGYPVGYIISWRNPDVKLKDGSLSMGKKVLIDGQQRVTAFTTALRISLGFMMWLKLSGLSFPRCSLGVTIRREILQLI